ncbi:hypothetical protein QUF63_06240 [Anaerolineales bacterium HSG25]|nr:hypothetical protein [Anaerolineales bacterium HSG25]
MLNPNLTKSSMRATVGDTSPTQSMLRAAAMFDDMPFVGDL